MKHVLGPASVLIRSQLEDGAVVVGATVPRRSIEISCLVKVQPRNRRSSVGAVRERAEAMQDVLAPATVLVRGQLEDGAGVLSAPGIGRAVEVSCLVKDQPSRWIGPVCAVDPRAEAMQDVLAPATVLVRGQLEDVANAVSAGPICSAVEVSCLVKDQPSIRDYPSAQLVHEQKLCRTCSVQPPF
jgi:hypothetical protein